MRKDNEGIAGEIRRRLLAWWEKHGRSFPWRETSDPWRILLAEVLLHRTRAEQVVPVYRTLTERFPDPASLAESPPGELEEIARPLGLHWRTSLIREMARQIANRHGGKVPAEKGALKELAGVSDYIAGAVRCFAFNQPEPLLDTNTVRVLGRLRGLPVSDGSRRSRRFREMMLEIVNCEEPRQIALALLDLAALICRPVNPACSECPVADFCSSRRVDGDKKRTADSAGP